MISKKIFKITIAGDGGSGKSSLIATKKNKNYKISSNITIGVDFACFPMEIDNNSFTFLIYDLGGQRRFQFLHNSYIIGTKGAIILYDLSRPSTFDHLEKWISLLDNEDSSMPIIIAGSKKDLVQPEDLIYFSKRWDEFINSIPNSARILDHLFISSKNYESVNQLFNCLGKAFLPNFKNLNLASISVSEN